MNYNSQQLDVLCYTLGNNINVDNKDLKYGTFKWEHEKYIENVPLLILCPRCSCFYFTYSLVAPMCVLRTDNNINWIVLLTTFHQSNFVNNIYQYRCCCNKLDKHFFNDILESKKRGIKYGKYILQFLYINTKLPDVMILYISKFLFRRKFIINKK